MEHEARYQHLHCLKQNGRETVNIVKDTEQNIVYLQRILQGSERLYAKLQQLQHSNLPLIESVHEENGQTIVLEEFVVGSTLKQILQTEHNLSEHEVREIAKQLCDVLEYLHRNGIIHRDIKPDNIIMTKSGTIKLIDFDIAREVKEEQSSDTTYMGTVGYAPPEQYGFAQTDQRADIYALGKTIEELLGSEYKGNLNDIVACCTEIDPKRRYRSIKAVGKAIRSTERPLLHQGKKIAYKLRYVIVFAVFCAIVYRALFAFDVLPIQKVTENTLEFQSVVNQSQEEFDGIYFVDGDAVWIFGYESMPFNDHGLKEFYPELRYVTYCVPRSYVWVTVRNTGEYTIKNPKIDMDFTDVQVVRRDDNSDLTYDNHVRGIGTYAGIIWQPKDRTGIAPGEEIQFKLYMNDAPVFETGSPSVLITITADNCPPKEFTIPIELD